MTGPVAMKRAAFALLAGICLSTGSARAGLFDDEEARARIEKLRSEIQALSQTVDTASKNQIDFANQLETLKTELAKLRGQLEVMAFDLETAQKRQKDFYVDLDARLRKLEPTTAAGVPAEAAPAEGTAATAAAPAAAKAPVDEAAAQRDYDAALGFIKAAKYREAVTAFNAFLKNHAGSEKQPSAHFWLASCHYQLREYARAAEQYAKVANGWPKDSKAPDALLGLANAQADAGDSKGATKTLEGLVQQYPNSSAAQSARLRLKKK